MIVEKLKHILNYARENSIYYRNVLPLGVSTLRAFSDSVPVLDSSELTTGYEPFLCIPLEKIRRIVSTSGSSGSTKRIAFSESDIERAINCFSQWMLRFLSPKDRVMICLPGTHEDGVCNLLERAAKNVQATALSYGMIQNIPDACQTLSQFRPDLIIGMPVPVMWLSELCTINVPNVMLTSDYASRAVRNRIARGLNSNVFTHYGSTEMGFAGALECEHHNLHPTEDLYFESCQGELIFTTLSYRAQPMIRYRTGDYGIVSNASCLCGKNITLSNVRRIEDALLHDLDEVLFSFPEILDYELSLSQNALTVYLKQGADPPKLKTEYSITYSYNISSVHTLYQKRVLH
jgi:phenylacetate-coenzyme A ligase PaaK-like adenylate-forming protein